MSTPAAHRSVATLKFPTRVPVLLSLARAIVLALTGNGSFPTPDPTLAVVNTAIADLEAAETVVVQTRAKGSASTRNEKRAALIALLHQLKGYVQRVADAADPAHAATLIHSAALNVKKVPVRAKRVFAVKQGTVSGSVALETASAARRASYEWEYSADGGKTWQAAAVTLQSRTGITGLQPGTSNSFRSRSVTKTGPSDWTPPIPLLVK
jgi:hypothetical protein